MFAVCIALTTGAAMGLAALVEATDRHNGSMLWASLLTIGAALSLNQAVVAYAALG